jgi:hypothetical protein
MWIKTSPDKPGWYGLREPDETPEIVEVFETSAHGLVARDREREIAYELKFFHEWWSADGRTPMPIVPPWEELEPRFQ